MHNYSYLFEDCLFRTRTIVSPLMILSAPDHWEEIAKRELTQQLAEYIARNGNIFKVDFACQEPGAVMYDMEIMAMTKPVLIRAVIAAAKEMRAMYDQSGRIYDYELPRKGNNL